MAHTQILALIPDLDDFGDEFWDCWADDVCVRSGFDLMLWVKTFRDIGVGWMYFAHGADVNIWGPEGRL